MTSKEIVLRALEFRHPPRLPLSGEDMIGLGYDPATGFIPAMPGQDEWGCVWKRLRPGDGDKGQVVAHPLADWAAFEKYRFPDSYAAGRFNRAQAWVRSNRETMETKFIHGDIGSGPMHLLDYLRGFENFMMDLVEAPERVEALLDSVFRFLKGLTEQYAALGCDGVFIADDQAMQRGPFFSMEMWRRYFQPRYTEFFHFAHEKHLKVWLHTCGDIRYHVPELAAMGVDLLDNKQPALWMNAPSIDEARGRISFSSCLDIQSVLQNISLDRVEEEVARLVHRLSTPAGGFVATRYGGKNLDLSAEILDRMWRAFRSFRWDIGALKERRL